MTKQDVINQISQLLGQHSLTSRTVIESFFEVVKQPPAAGESVYVRGLGSFVPTQRGAKVTPTINQHTAHPIKAHMIPVFKLSTEFKEQVRAQLDTEKAK